jgi:hypothetical protein
LSHLSDTRKEDDTSIRLLLAAVRAFVRAGMLASVLLCQSGNLHTYSSIGYH